MVREQPTGSIAVFVKTPGLSPIKTRLAEVMGKERAVRFHVLASQAVGGLVRRLCEEYPQIVPIWAVAEKEGMEFSGWSGFSRICQGSGGLGERLDHIYSSLQKDYRSVLLLGADSPHLAPSLIREALIQLNQPEPLFVLGRALDGGFYLFAGNRP